ncbi:hypothetical protein ACCI51_05230 [Microbulbifer echini]|uniref:Peptidase M15 n=1 Tax=Microbulbifer echini TaxID=1529067 RepID=A0ABV4NL12_9GAMM|nr:hypothetical protein [uncultured Microbulbifer sp.]
MSEGNSFTRFRTLYPHQPPGRRTNFAVVASLTLLLTVVLVTLWLWLWFKAQEKPYVETKGYRIASEESFKSFLRNGNNRAQVKALSDYLESRGLSEVTAVSNLLRQGEEWLELEKPAFALPPQGEWSKMADTLKLLREQVVPLIGPVAVISGFRSDSYNRELEHSDKARHRAFCALDLIPTSNISHGELVEELQALHARLGPESRFGLGLGNGVLFHIDTCGYRTWQLMD